jgi:hypothetical protein
MVPRTAIFYEFILIYTNSDVGIAGTGKPLPGMRTKGALKRIIIRFSGFPRIL